MAATLDEILDALLDNAGFEENDSLSEAHAFITAAKRYLILSPASQGDQGSSMSMNSSQVENLLSRAQAFVAAKSQSSAQNSSVRFLCVGASFR